MKFTTRSVESLKPKQKRFEEYDDNLKGFGIRVNVSGHKSWITRYRHNGKLVKLTLGKYTEVSLADARDTHNKIRSQLNLGLNPQAEAQAKRVVHRQDPTVEQLVEDYIERYAKPRKRTWKIDEWTLNKDLVPKFGKMKARDIKRQHIITMLDEVQTRGITIGANRLLAITGKMFNWAIGRGILENSPCHLVPRPVPENRRDRVLTQDELITFWQNLPQLKILEPVKLALQLMLVTGQRKGEVLTVEKENLDFKTNWWTIPAEKAKNGLSHRVPLSPLAIDLFNRAINLSQDSRWVFASPYKKKTDGHINPQSINHGLRKNIDKLNIGNFVPHDLRRTAASYMTGMGIPRLVVKKILNHVESDITAVYDRHSYDREKREALETWGYKLEEIITSNTTNVVSFRKAR